MYEIQGYSYVTFEWFMVALTFIAVLIRLYVRVYSRRGDLTPKSWRWAEFFVVCGWVLFLGLCICDSLVNHLGAHNLDPKFDPPDSQWIEMNKVYQAWTYFYKPSIYAMKAAMLCLYNELTPKSHYSAWISIRIIGVCNFLGLLSQIIYTSIDCPVSWLKWDPKACPGSEGYEITTWTFHLTTDLMVFLFPFFMLRRMTLNMPPRQKLGVYAMFGMGVVNIFSAIVLMTLRLMAMGPTGDNISNTATVEVLQLLFIVQSATAVFIPCLPQLRIFYKKLMKKLVNNMDEGTPKTGLAGEETMVTGKSDQFWRKGGWLWAGISRSMGTGVFSTTRERTDSESGLGTKYSGTVSNSRGNASENGTERDREAAEESGDSIEVVRETKGADDKV